MPASRVFARTRSTPPSSLYGFVRVVPTIVPPRGRMPEISRSVSGWNVPSTRPRHPSRTATPSSPRSPGRLVPAIGGAPRHGGDHGVQPGAVPAAGEECDPSRHGRNPTGLLQALPQGARRMRMLAALRSRGRPKWRNWQTRRTQNPVPERACGFDPHLRHLQRGARAAFREVDCGAGSRDTAAATDGGSFEGEGGTLKKRGFVALM